MHATGQDTSPRIPVKGSFFLDFDRPCVFVGYIDATSQMQLPGYDLTYAETQLTGKVSCARQDLRVVT